MKLFPVLLFLALIYPQNLLAQLSNVIINQLPEAIKIDQQSSLNFEASLEPDTKYYFKVRLGKAELEHGLTYNPETNKWLNDTSPYLDHPFFISNSEGSISASLKFKAAIQANTGENKLELSYTKDDVINTYKSNQRNIQLLAADSTPTPTPAPTPTPVATPEPNYSNVRINEVYPNPDEQERQWLEIYNPDLVDLKNCYLVDNKGIFFTFDHLSNKYIVYEINSTSGRLSDTKDEIHLYSPSSNIIHSFTYTSTQKALSWSYMNDSFCLTTPSRGVQNDSCYSADSQDNQDEGETISATTDELEITQKPNPFLSKNNQASPQSSLPDFNRDSQQASIAGISHQSAPLIQSSSNRIPPLAFIISGLGFLLMSGASAPFIYPKLKPILAKIRKTNPTI